jgi:hypothetical protein
MNHRDRVFSRVIGALGVAGGVVVLLGTYWISWFSLSSLTSSVPRSFGGSTLYHLQTFVTNGWYTYASQVMALGAVILVVRVGCCFRAEEQALGTWMCHRPRCGFWNCARHGVRDWPASLVHARAAPLHPECRGMGVCYWRNPWSYRLSHDGSYWIRIWEVSS